MAEICWRSFVIMKKREVICLIMLFSTILWSGEKNLLVNPEFKLNSSKGIPRAWQLSSNAIGDVVKLPNKSRALEITGAEAGKKYWWLQTLPAVKEGQRYLLSGKIKADVGTQCAIYVECNSPWKTISTGIIKGNGQWQEFTKTIQFDTLNKTPYLVLRVTAPGKAQFAEIKLVTVKKELIRDSGFREINNQGKLIHWRANIPEATKRIVIDSKAALQLTSVDKKKVFFQQINLPIKAGEKYQITVKFKGSIGAIFSSYVESNKPWQTAGSAKISCNGQWQELKYFVTLKPFQNPPYLILRLQGGGEVVITGVEMKQIGQSLRNCDFSRGSENWQLEGAKIIDTKGGRGLALEANCVKKNFSATQPGITVTGKSYYQLTYEVRGGNDRTYRDSQGAVWFRVYPIQNGKPIPGTDVWLDAFDSWQKKTVNFVSQSGDITIKCEAKAPGCVWFDNISLTQLKSPLPPLELALDGSVAYRFGIYSSNRHEKMFSGAVWDNNRENSTTLKLTFNGKEYPLTLGEKGNYIFKLPVPTEVGEYPIVVERLDKNNKVTASITERFQVNPPAAREVTFRSDKVMLIDGKPFFPLGVWTVKGKLTPEEITKRIADAGFNIGLCIDPMLMDTYAANGMLCQLKIPAALPKFKNKEHFNCWDKMYRKEMQQYIKHPALVSYFIADEPAWGGHKVSPIIESYKYIRSLDPYRPVLLNEAPRGKLWICVRILPVAIFMGWIYIQFQHQIPILVCPMIKL